MWLESICQSGVFLPKIKLKTRLFQSNRQPWKSKRHGWFIPPSTPEGTRVDSPTGHFAKLSLGDAWCFVLYPCLLSHTVFHDLYNHRAQIPCSPRAMSEEPSHLRSWKYIQKRVGEKSLITEGSVTFFGDQKLTCRWVPCFCLLSMVTDGFTKTEGFHPMWPSCVHLVPSQGPTTCIEKF